MISLLMLSSLLSYPQYRHFANVTYYTICRELRLSSFLIISSISHPTYSTSSSSGLKASRQANILSLESVYYTQLPGYPSYHRIIPPSSSLGPWFPSLLVGGCKHLYPDISPPNLPSVSISSSVRVPKNLSIVVAFLAIGTHVYSVLATTSYLLLLYSS